MTENKNLTAQKYYNPGTQVMNAVPQVISATSALLRVLCVRRSYNQRMIRNGFLFLSDILRAEVFFARRGRGEAPL